MKRVLYLLILVVLAVACKTEPKYVINGNVNAKDSTAIYLQKRVSGVNVVIDSAVIMNGVFKMKGVIDYPQMVMLGQKGVRGGKMFFIENSEINISGSIDSLYAASVTGSATEAEYEAYQALFDDLNKQMEQVYGSYKKASEEGNQPLADSLQNELNDMDGKMLVIKKDYVTAHPASFVTPVVLNDASYYMDVPEIESMINSLDTTLNKVAVITNLKEKVKVMKAVQVGQKAPDFTLNDVNGAPVSLYSQIDGKTKLLLIDFWASWCGYCRQENPNVVKVFTDFNKKGFNVFGVSLDSNGDNWKKAIADDKLTWTQVSDLQYWNSAAAKLYAVNGIPANFLLDENGVIIAHNIMGDDLYNKVKEILGEKK